MTKDRRELIRHQSLVRLLTNLLGPLDDQMIADIEAGIEWVHLRKGELLFRQGDPGDSLFIVLNGRLRAIVHIDGQADKVLGDIVKEESVGEMALFTDDERSASVYAIRDCELAKFSQDLFEKIKTAYPQVLMPISKVMIERLKRANVAATDLGYAKNITVFPAESGLDIDEFTNRLSKSIAQTDKVLTLTSTALDLLLSVPGISQASENTPDEFKIMALLDEQESQVDYIIFQADAADTEWTRRCIRQSDQVLVVGNENGSPHPGELESNLLYNNINVTTPETSLIILHKNSQEIPTGTGEWLKPRLVKDHFHICLANKEDMARLARILTNRAIGLVLGGGGSRGYAHIGVIRALTEMGVPIDMVGGTSMGAIIASQCAMRDNWEEMVALQRKINNEVKPFKEYNLPLVSIYGRKRLDRAMHEFYGNTQIEDLWLPSFYVSTNLTKAEAKIHRHGSLKMAASASLSLPGVLPPVVDNDDLLVDGCVLNNLPGDIMREICRGKVMVVNINPKEDLVFEEESLTRYPTPREVLFSRLNPFKKSLHVPNIIKIMMRSSMLRTISQESEIAREADFYLQPPVDDYGIMDLDALDDIVAVGYSYTLNKIQEWKDDKSLELFI